MALWVERSSKRKEIEKYFSSINCMSLRIVEDIKELRRKHGATWEEMSAEEQEKRIDEFMVPGEVKKNYPLPETNDYSDIFPALRIDTGQKIVEVTTEQCESPTAWYDEFSVPFSWETKSQMDLRLPPTDGSKEHRRLSSQKSNKSQKDFSEKAKDRPNKSKGSKKEKDDKMRKKSSKPNCTENKKSGTVAERLNFNLSNSEFSTLDYESSKLSESPRITESRSGKKYDDYIVPDILPSSELSKAYEESEFLDLYPQKIPVSQEPTTKLISSKPEKKPSKEYQQEVPTAPSSVLRQKKHRKKPSFGNQQVNPRSSLTLDGAILNLEIAAEINKKGVVPQTSQEKVFSNEDDLFRQIKKDTVLESWLTDTKSESNDEPRRTGFDFLDEW